MELRQVTYAVAVADAGSFTEAARRCHVAQSALSTQVAQLESELGSRLFHRTTRRVTITDAGRVFLPAARRLLADAACLHADMIDLVGRPVDTLRVGATQTASRILDLPAVLGRFHRLYPQAGLTMTAGPTSELTDLVARGELDLALAGPHYAETRAALSFRALASPEPLVAIVPANCAVARQRSASLADLAGIGPFLEFRANTALRELVDRAFADAGVHRSVAFELGQISDIVRCAAHGLGVAVVPAVFAAGLDKSSVAVLAVRDADLTITVGAYTRTHDRGPTTQAALALFPGIEK